MRVVDYHEHALGEGADADGGRLRRGRDGDGAHAFGVGRHANLITASLRAVMGAVRARRADGSAPARPTSAATVRTDVVEAVTP